MGTLCSVELILCRPTVYKVTNPAFVTAYCKETLSALGKIKTYPL